MEGLIFGILRYIKYQSARKRGRHVWHLKGLSKLKTIQPERSNFNEYARRRWLFSKNPWKKLLCQNDWTSHGPAGQV